MRKPIPRRSTTGAPPAPKPEPTPIPKRTPPPPAELVYYEDIIQGSDDWFEVRRGKATSSEFGAIMSSSEEALTRGKLLRQLAGEILTGEPRAMFSNRDTDRGKELEPVAREYYEQSRFVTVRQVGFVWNPDVKAGWSPDGLVGDDGAIEIKCVRPDILIAILEKGTFPAEHRAQCFGGAFLVGRRQWCDLVIFSHPKMPKFVARVTPNDVYQRQIKDAVEVFNWDLQQLVSRMQKLGL